MFVEKALWKELGQLTAEKDVKLICHLHFLDGRYGFGADSRRRIVFSWIPD